MLRIRMIGLALVAVFAMGAVAAASASAEHLEFGKCVEQAGAGTKYKDANCLEVSATGKFEWVPLAAGSNVPFTATSPAGKLVTVGGEEVNCEKDKAVGHLTGPTTDLATVTFEGCTGLLGVKCTTAGQAAGTIVSTPLKSLLVWLKTTPPLEAGLLLEPVTPPTFATFVCGGVETLTVRGSVLVPLTVLNAMSTTFTLTSNETKGKAAFTEYQKTCATTKTKPATLETEGTGLKPFKFEQSGISGVDTVSFSEKWEVWASCP
jgi:hypothetical protein